MSCSFALRVFHTMVQHATGTRHAGNILDRSADAVRCVITRPFVVPLVVVELLTVSAAEPRFDECSFLHDGRYGGGPNVGRSVQGVPFLETGGRVTSPANE